MFEVRGLRVFFLTRHVSLIEACKMVKKERIIDYVKRCLDALKKLGVTEGTMAVAGLNPHSGEHGLFGTEEVTDVTPAVEALQKEGYPVAGPVGADSVFHLALIGKFNSVLSLYHDQGHIATKTLDFERTISVTGGMPILRPAVGHGTTLTAEAKGFQDTYYEDGSPKDYVADLAIYDGGEEVANREVRINSPLSYDGVVFHQAYFGVAAVLTITDDSGAEVFHDGVALDRTTRDKKLTYGRTTLPDGNTVFVIGAASGQTGTGIEPGQMKIEVHEGETSTPVGEAVLDTGVPATVGAYTFDFEREQQFTGMIVKKDPGIGIVWFGFVLLMVGTCMTMFFRHQRMWVRVTETDDGALVQMASPDRQDSGFTRFFTDMTVRVSSDMTRADERTRAND